MEGWNILAQILILLAAATFFGLAAQRVRQNAITGYLLAGVVLAPFFLRAAGRDVIRLLAEIGVAMLLFTIGLEFSMARLRTLGPRVVWLGLAQILGTLAVVAAMGRAAGLPGPAAVVIGAAAAMSSTTVIMRLISERSELDSAYGRAAMGVSLMQDLAVVPAMLLVPLLAGAQEGGQGLRLLGAALAKAVGLLGVLYVLMRWITPRWLLRAAGFQNRDLPVLLSAVVCLGSSWVSHALGLSAALGAFAAGIILSECLLAEQIRADVIPLRAAFLPLFFTSAGMLAGVADWGSAGWLGLFWVILVLVKTGVVMVAGAALRMTASDALRTGLALAQTGEFSFVLLEFGRSAGLLEEKLFRLLLAVSVVSLLASPPLASAGLRLAMCLQKG
ncbi:MAG: cation:proton antiporter, partial [Bryobacteraceae bacterium]